MAERGEGIPEIGTGGDEEKGHGCTVEKVETSVKDGTKVAEVKMSKRALKREKQWRERQQRQREQRREEKKRRTKKKREQGVGGRTHIPLSDARASNLKVALDCAFDQLMTSREREGLAKQIKYCYASNRASAKPIQLHVCGYGGGVKECLDKSSPEHVKWDIHLHGEELTQVFTPDQLVYLTADSSDVMKEVSADKCYVIGALVDHNRHKRVCLKRANELGISHARLGLEEVVKLNSRSVLTVNHVFDIMLRYASSEDWKDAILGSLPARKIEYVKGQSNVRNEDVRIQSGSTDGGVKNQSDPEDRGVKNQSDPEDRGVKNQSDPENGGVKNQSDPEDRGVRNKSDPEDRGVKNQSDPEDRGVKLEVETVPAISSECIPI